MKKKVLLSLGVAATLAVAFGATPTDTFVWYTFGEYETLDPTKAYDASSSERLEQAYETLITYKGTSIKAYEPALATAYKVSPDGKQVVFTLRKNVKFHSGNIMTCADAEYSFRRILINADPSSFAFALQLPLLGTTDDAKTDKSITFERISKAAMCDSSGNLVFNLVQKDPAFLGKLIYTANSVLDSKNAIKLGDWSGTEKDWQNWIGVDLANSVIAKNPSGTGPYKVLAADPAGETLMTAFDDYWGGKPKIKNILFKVVPDENQRITAFNKGDADRVDLGARASLSKIEDKANIIDDIPPSQSAPAMFLQQNIKDKDQLGSGKLDGNGAPANFFADANTRLGFAYAFDYQRAIKEVLLGKGETRTMALPKPYLGYDTSIDEITYNPEKAAEYFKKAFAGKLWSSGFKISVYFNNGNTTRQKYGEILKAGIEALNPKFKVEVKSIPFAQLLRDSDAGKIPVMIGSWTADYPDSDNFIRTFYRSDGVFAGRTSFKDSQIDKWVDEAYDTYDANRRESLYKAIGRRASKLAPIILLPAATGWRVVSKNLNGYKDNFNPILSSDVFIKKLSK